MREHIIRIDAARPNLPLPVCAVGRLSSAVFRFVGDIPCDVTGLSLQIGRTPDPATHEERPNFCVAVEEIAGAASRMFRAYLSPFCFPDVSDYLGYHVMGTDANNNPRWLGTGNLRVLECPANGTPVPPEIIPQDTYVRNPVTGLYHKLVAELNEDNQIVVAVDPKGVER